MDKLCEIKVITYTRERALQRCRLLFFYGVHAYIYMRTHKKHMLFNALADFRHPCVIASARDCTCIVGDIVFF